MKKYGCQILMPTLCILLCVGGLARSNAFLLERHGDRLNVVAPQQHFLSGKSVEMLQNGSTVTYILTLTVTPENSRKHIVQLHDKFIVSYDLWEEKYSVARMRDSRMVSRLTAVLAEAWCLENMPISIRSIPERQPFMIRLECSIEDKEEKESGETSGLTLSSLVEIFARKKQAEPLRWEMSDGPFRLEELKSSR
jgi:hypothetical protein